MTAVLPDRTRSAAEVGHDLRHKRPLVLLAPLAGVLAASGTLVVCLALGVAGWFLTDAGEHGAPRDGLRTGALAWLMAHGSGVHVEGVLVTLMPLGISLGINPLYLIAMFPAVNGYFFLPTYGTIVAAIQFDQTGTTGIGRFLLNHSFMLPGLVATIGAIAIGFAVAALRQAVVAG